MAMEIGKGIGKVKVAFFGILVMKIMENRRKGRRKVIELHEDEIKGKLRKNEENRGLNDKEDFED